VVHEGIQDVPSEYSERSMILFNDNIETLSLTEELGGESALGFQVSTASRIGGFLSTLMTRKMELEDKLNTFSKKGHSRSVSRFASRKSMVCPVEFQTPALGIVSDTFVGETDIADAAVLFRRVTSLGSWCLLNGFVTVIRMDYLIGGW